MKDQIKALENIIREESDTKIPKHIYIPMVDTLASMADAIAEIDAKNKALKQTVETMMKGGKPNPSFNSSGGFSIG